MNISQITNNNLLQAAYEVKDYLDNGNEPPFEVFLLFIKELEYSRLLIPGVVDEGSISFSTLTSEDDDDFIPLFTSEYEYCKIFDETDAVSPVPIDIRDCIGFLDEGDFRGIVIDAGSLNFPMISEVLRELPLDSIPEISDNFEGYSPEKLKKIADNASNDELLRLMHESEDFHEFLMELSTSAVLNLLVGEDESDDEIISSENLDVCSIDDENGVFAILFTDKESILKATDFSAPFNYSYQLTAVPEFVEFVLRSDMEGILINPGIDNYLIPREALLIEKEFLIGNPNFKKAMDYAFKFYQ